MRDVGEEAEGEPIGVQRTTRSLAIAAVDALFNARSDTLYDVVERAIIRDLDIEDESGGECVIIVQAVSVSPEEPSDG